MDLDAYLQRIGYTGSREPDLATLRAVVLAHVQTIAFESLDPFMGREVRLDVESLERKLVHSGRGGYCFEQNLLLDHALRALGFQTTGLAARVTYMQADDAPTPRSHMLLRVDLDGATWLADVGFGGLTLTGVLRLEPDTVQSTPHEPFRLLRDGDAYRLQAHAGEQWRTLYRFDLQPQLQSDYAVTSWYAATHPQSRFVTGFIASLPAPGRRYSLRETEFTEHRLDGVSTRRTLSGAQELRATLETTFGLSLPPGPEVDAALRRLF